MSTSFVYDAVRTPFGRYGKALSEVRPDDLAAHVLAQVVARHPKLDPSRVDDVIWAMLTRQAKTTATSRGWQRSWRAFPPRCLAQP